MAQKIQINASVTDGTLQLSIFRVRDNVLLGRINNNGNIAQDLEAGVDYIVIYHVFAKEDGCKYEVEITSPPQARIKDQLELKHAGNTDYNSIPFTA